MNNIKNYVQLIGRLGQDPELKSFDSGNKLVAFSLATNDTFINKAGEKVDNTHWHNIKAWGKLAEIISKYAKKGDQIVIQGKLSYNSYEDKNQNTRRISEITANEFMNLEKVNKEEVALADA